MSAKWKAVFDSVTGTSHTLTGAPCQDACRAIEATCTEGRLLIACVADGAGSATHSELGSAAACDTFVNYVSTKPDLITQAVAASNDVVLSICKAIREKLKAIAQDHQVELRQLATTFLAAIVSESSALFIQIGDGAIVRKAEEGYTSVFWPQSGEFANTTYFITDDRFEERLLHQVMTEAPDEIALFTDGLERLILKFDSQTVHSPFFSPFFDAIRRTNNPEDLFPHLRIFLNSSRVNERTDDDKTLLLATRLES